MHDDLDQLAARLGERLSARGWSFASAESCTGGWIAKVATDISGSSGWFDRGFVTYSNRAKQEMLGVSEQTLTTHGAVSEAVVREMAEGALERSAASLTVAVSGIAGPGGGSAEKPVGLVWFAWSGGSGTEARWERLDGDRDTVRALAVRVALEGLLARVETPGVERML